MIAIESEAALLHHGQGPQVSPRRARYSAMNVFKRLSDPTAAKALLADRYKMTSNNLNMESQKARKTKIAMENVKNKMTVSHVVLEPRQEDFDNSSSKQKKSAYKDSQIDGLPSLDTKHQKTLMQNTKHVFKPKSQVLSYPGSPKSPQDRMFSVPNSPNSQNDTIKGTPHNPKSPTVKNRSPRLSEMTRSHGRHTDNSEDSMRSVKLRRQRTGPNRLMQTQEYLSHASTYSPLRATMNDRKSNFPDPSRPVRSPTFKMNQTEKLEHRNENENIQAAKERKTCNRMDKRRRKLLNRTIMNSPSSTLSGESETYLKRSSLREEAEYKSDSSTDTGKKYGSQTRPILKDRNVNGLTVSLATLSTRTSSPSSRCSSSTEHHRTSPLPTFPGKAKLGSRASQARRVSLEDFAKSDSDDTAKLNKLLRTGSIFGDKLSKQCLTKSEDDDEDSDCSLMRRSTYSCGDMEGQVPGRRGTFAGRMYSHSLSEDNRSKWKKGKHLLSLVFGENRRSSSVTESRFKEEGDAKTLFRQCARKVWIVLLWTSLLKGKEDELNKQLKSFLDIATDFSEDNNDVHHIQEVSGIAFDPEYYKANKEIRLSDEVKDCITLPSESRTPEMIQKVLISLRGCKAFAEYPPQMQIKFATVGWYQHIPAKRMILKQGHEAENFYFILAGAAIVKKISQDSAGEISMRAVARVQKGQSFGEISLIQQTVRTATVESITPMDLLVIDRNAFERIFFNMQNGKDPEHILFCKENIKFLREFPMEKFRESPRECMFHYFRPGAIVVPDSSKTEYIYIVKSGTCQILKKLNNVAPSRSWMSKSLDLSQQLPKLGTTLPGPKIDTGLRKSHTSSSSTSVYSRLDYLTSIQSKDSAPSRELTNSNNNTLHKTERNDEDSSTKQVNFNIQNEKDISKNRDTSETQHEQESIRKLRKVASKSAPGPRKSTQSESTSGMTEKISSSDDSKIKYISGSLETPVLHTEKSDSSATTSHPQDGGDMTDASSIIYMNDSREPEALEDDVFVDNPPKIADTVHSNDNQRNTISPTHSRPTSSVEFDRNKSQSFNSCRDKQDEIIESTKTNSEQEPCYVMLRHLRKKDVFGLENVVFDDDNAFNEPKTSVILVSRGAELIMMSKKFFEKHANMSVKQYVREQVRQFPSEDTLQDNLQIETNWDLFRKDLVTDLLTQRREFRGLMPTIQ